MHEEAIKLYGYKNPIFYLPELRVKGTESNASRLSRLCWKYRIPPSIFFNEYLKSGSPVSRSFFKFEVASHLNSYTNKTIEYEKRLNHLTGTPDDKCFSYSFLNSALDKAAHGFLSESKKWCPACYRERFHRNDYENGIFDDLYWSVEPIKTCMLHGYVLRSKCSNCFSRQPYISTAVEPGYCHHCLSFLGHGYEHYVGEEELEHQKQLFTLFYVDTYEEIRPAFDTLVENLKSLKQAYPDATSKYLGNAMGVSDDVVKKWISGKRKPRLATLFQLQKVLGLYGPHQLFYKPDIFINKVLLAKSLSLKFNTRSRFAGMVKDKDIKEEFELILSGKKPTVSRSDFAKQFEVSEGFLTSRYAIHCEQLSVAHSNRLEYEREQRAKDLIEQFTLALGKVRSRKRRWTIANAVEELMDPSIVSGMSDIDLVMAFEKAKVRLREWDIGRKSTKSDRKWLK